MIISVIEMFNDYRFVTEYSVYWYDVGSAHQLFQEKAMEIWKPIKDLPGYSVSNEGRVRKDKHWPDYGAKQKRRILPYYGYKARPSTGCRSVSG